MTEPDTRPSDVPKRDAAIPARMGTCFVGVDGTSAGSVALAWAVRRGAQRGDRIVLVHVLESDRAGIRRIAPGSDTDPGEILEGALEAACRLQPRAAISTLLLRGSVARELAAVGSSGDMLVIGTHMTGYLRGRLVGARSVFIATTARSSVAVVPEFDHAFRRGVLVGVDGLGPSVSAVTCAAGEAERLGEHLTLLCAVPPPFRDQCMDADDRAALHAALLGAAALADDAPEVSTRVVCRPIADGLLDAAGRASLLVLGASHGNRVEAVAGPVAHDVLLNINAPVIIARAGA